MMLMFDGKNEIPICPYFKTLVHEIRNKKMVDIFFFCQIKAITDFLSDEVLCNCLYLPSVQV